MKTLVAESAIRDLVREAFDTPPPFDVALVTQEEDLPVIVNPSVDDSLVSVELSPVDVNFVPHDKTEFQIAVKQMTKNLPDDVIADLYAKVREIVMDTQATCDGPDGQGDTEEMEKRDNTRLGMEESLRRAVRNMLSEEMFAEEDKDDKKDEEKPEEDSDSDSEKEDFSGLASSSEESDEEEFSDDTFGDDDFGDKEFGDEEFEPESRPVLNALAGAKPGRRSASEEIADILAATAAELEAVEDSPEETEERAAGLKAHKDDIWRDENPDLANADKWDTSDIDAASDWDPEPVAAPAKAKRKEAETGYGVEGEKLRDIYKKIADEFGFGSPSGVERLMNTGLAKLQYMAELSDEDVADILGTAAGDWIVDQVEAGRLPNSEGRMWLKHLKNGVVDELLKMPEFREYLNSYIKDEMDKDDEWPYAEDPSTMKKDAAGKPIPKSGKVRHRSLHGKPARGSKDDEE